VEELVYLNGRLLPRAQARISPLDHGFLYGYGLFETMRAYKGHIFRLNAHIERLLAAAKLLGFASKLSAAMLKQACVEVLEANQLEEASVRLAVSAGEGEPRPDPATCQEPTVFIVARTYVPPSPEAYERGFSAVMASLRRDSQSPLSYLKSANFLLSLLARQEARGAGADEALLLNERGHVAEGSLSNIFLGKGGRLFTPDQESGILPGITRQVVLELAHSLGVAVKEDKLGPEALLSADEAFLTNSLIEVMPLTQIGGKAIGSGRPGPLTVSFMAAYKELVARETGIAC